MHWLDTVVAVLAAIGSICAAFFTWKLVKGQLVVSKEQVKVQLYLELRKEFDSDRLTTARKLLASQLLHDVPHGELREEAMNFFEDMGMLIRRSYLDEEMVWDTFSYYARMWWNACKDYIAKEREQKNDETLFTDFERLAERMSGLEAQKRNKQRAALEPSVASVKTFLHEEAE